MNYFLKEMEQRLSENDKFLLKEIYEPQVVTIPPSDAFNYLTVMPDGELRIYGAIRKDKVTRTNENEGVHVYIRSTNCGLTWETVVLKKGDAFASGAYSPKTGRYFEVMTNDAYHNTSRTNFAFENLIEGHLYLMISDKGADSPVEKFIDLYPEGKAHMARKPLFLKDSNRMIIVFQKYDKYVSSVVVATSDDNGETWKTQVLENAGYVPKIEGHEGVRWQNYSCEPTIEECEDGTLILITRTSHNYHYIQYSYDHGDTWTKTEPSIFHGTNTMPVLYKLHDGRLLFFWSNNQPLPEIDCTKVFPPVGWAEIEGVGEDVFTNRDSNCVALSDKSGKVFEYARELYLNDIRNHADFRSNSGVATANDKSIHQAEMCELPFGKVLVHFGQNEASRKVVIFDLNWLMEKQREENFRTGLKNVSTQMYVKSNLGNYRNFSGHCAYNRTNGALLLPDPEGNHEEVLSIGRIEDERLVYKKQGAVWNYPASKKGSLNIKLRVLKSGVAISLSDHWYNPCDETAKIESHISFDITKDIAPDDKWTDIKVDFDTEKSYAKIYADNELIKEEKITENAPLGLMFVHIQTLAEGEDFEGTLIKHLAFQGK
ncbi:MAG: exo-alpha-sialidase [Ruminococcaceae bacterium]|nr:exo-alpha-sialidase [Oscillospiraceae bacterium]